MSRTARNRRRAGFTLIEVLVAMALLVVGMSGILSLFTTALTIESEAEERHTLSQRLPEILAHIRQDLAGPTSRPGGQGKRAPAAEFLLEGPIPYRVQYEVESIPGDQDGRGLLAKIIVEPAAGGREAVDFGYYPIILPSGNEALLRPPR